MRISRSLLLFVLLPCMACGLRAQTVIFENFNSGIPGSWTVVNGGTTSDTWFGTNNGYNNNYLDGSEFAFVDSDAAGNGSSIDLSEILMTPVINGSLYTQLFLEFDHYYREYSQDSGFVEVFNGSTWITLAAYSTDQGAWNNPAHPTFNLSPYLNPNLRVRFRYEDNTIWAWWWAVDNVYIYAPLALDAKLAAVHVPSSRCGLSASETIGVDIKNEGSNTINSFSASYRINNGPVVTESVSMTIASGATVTYNFNTAANLSAAGLYNIKTWVTLSGDGNPVNDSLAAPAFANHLRFTSLPYVEDFESGPGGWFATGQNSTWAHGTPAKDVIIGAASGTKAWVTGGLGTTDYLNDEQNQVEGPCLDLSGTGNPWVGLNIWWNAEWSWDGAALQATTDNGQSWVTVGAFGDPYSWYTDNTIDALPGGQDNGWTGRAASNDGSNGYRRAVHGLLPFAGQSEVIFRVVFASDGSVRDDGVAFDDFTVGSAPALYLGPDTTVCDSLVLDAGPASTYAWNTGDTTRYLTTDSSGVYQVEIRDGYGFPVGDQIQVTIFNTSGLDLGADTAICSGTGLSLQADPAGQSFLWSTGDTVSVIQAGTTGQYWVQVTYPPGCMASDTIGVGISALQAGISLVSDTLCRGLPTPFGDGSTGAQTWWWDFGDGGFSNLPNPNHTYVSGGTFLVRLTVTDSTCTHTADRVVFVDVCSGRPEPDGTVCRMFPNPAGDAAWLELDAPAPTPLDLELTDVNGTVLLREEWRAGTATRRLLDLRDYPSGVYFIRLSGTDLHWSGKLTVMH